VQVDGFAVEVALRRLREHLLPCCERVNRQLLQHLQALQRPRPGSSPMVAIGQVGYFNIAQQQVIIQQEMAVLLSLLSYAEELMAHPLSRRWHASNRVWVTAYR
jgi:hypothetical protein